MSSPSDLTTAESQTLTSGLEFNKKEVLARMMGKQEKEVGQKAYKLFQNEDYGAVINQLMPLARKWSHDPRLLHNIAVSEFLKSGKTQTAKFHDDLKKAADDGKLIFNYDDIPVDVDYYPFLYNQALIFANIRKYDSAILNLHKILETPIQIYEPIGRSTVLLLIEIYLETFRPHLALEIISNIENQLNDDSRNDDHHILLEDEFNEFKVSLIYYKCRCYIGLKSMKNCKRELRTLSSLGRTWTASYLLRVEYEYLRKNEQKAMKILNGEKLVWSTEGVGMHQPTMFYNNSAVLHFSVNKPNIALNYLINAAREDENVLERFPSIENINEDDNDRPIHCLQISVRHIINYNTGIALLFSNKPKLAFEYLLESVKIFGKNPRLWLRLAQACIKIQREADDINKPNTPILKVIGRGVHRKLILNTINLDNCSVNVNVDGTIMPCLEFALQCLHNALEFLPINLSNDYDKEYTHNSIVIPAPPTSPLRYFEIIHVKNEVLTALSYVTLSLKIYVMAKEYAEMLLQQPYLSHAQRFSGQMYLAETLVNLDKISDATVHLQANELKERYAKPEIAPDCDIPHPFDSDRPTFGDLSRAEGVMLYNLAVTHAIRGDFSKALTLLKSAERCLDMKMYTQLDYLRLYLLLMDGRKKEVEDMVDNNFNFVDS